MAKPHLIRRLVSHLIRSQELLFKTMEENTVPMGPLPTAQHLSLSLLPYFSTVFLGHPMGLSSRPQCYVSCTQQSREHSCLHLDSKNGATRQSLGLGSPFLQHCGAQVQSYVWAGLPKAMGVQRVLGIAAEVGPPLSGSEGRIFAPWAWKAECLIIEDCSQALKPKGTCSAQLQICFRPVTLFFFPFHALPF